MLEGQQCFECGQLDKKLALVLTGWALFACVAYLRCFGIGGVVRALGSFCRGVFDETKARLHLGPTAKLWANGWYGAGVTLVRSIVVWALMAAFYYSITWAIH